MIRAENRNFAFAEQAITNITQNPITGAAYRDESLTTAEIETGNRYNILVNFATIINQYRFLLGQTLQAINNSGVLPWSADTAYTNGAVTVYDSKIYISQIANNTGNTPDSSVQWKNITDFLESEFLRIDLSNGAKSGSGNTIVMQDAPSIINANVGTQPDGTSDETAASTAFVENAAGGQASSKYTPAAPLMGGGGGANPINGATPRPCGYATAVTGGGGNVSGVYLVYSPLASPGDGTELRVSSLYNPFLSPEFNYPETPGSGPPLYAGSLAGTIDCSVAPLQAFVDGGGTADRGGAEHMGILTGQADYQ